MERKPEIRRGRPELTPFCISTACALQNVTNNRQNVSKEGRVLDFAQGSGPHVQGEGGVNFENFAGESNMFNVPTSRTPWPPGSLDIGKYFYFL